MSESQNNPMRGRIRALCGAKTRQGSPCKGLPMKNGRCRMHGGPSTGAPKGNQNALKHGRYSAEAQGLDARVAELLSAFKDLNVNG